MKWLYIMFRTVQPLITLFVEEEPLFNFLRRNILVALLKRPPNIKCTLNMTDENLHSLFISFCGWITVRLACRRRPLPFLWCVHLPQRTGAGVLIKFYSWCFSSGSQFSSFSGSLCSLTMFHRVNLTLYLFKMTAEWSFFLYTTTFTIRVETGVYDKLVFANFAPGWFDSVRCWQHVRRFSEVHRSGRCPRQSNYDRKWNIEEWFWHTTEELRGILLLASGMSH